MALPNLTFNPYIKPYVGGIANELGQVVQQKTAQFYQNAEQDDVLGYQADTLKNLIMDNPNDQAYADQILNQTRTELTDRAKRGDYENMFREVKRSARKFSANVAPLLQRKQQYDSYLKSMSEELGKGTWGRDTYNRAIQYSKDNDKGYIPGDSTTLSFRGFQPTKDESAAEIVNKFLGNDFKGSKTVRQFFNPKTMTMDKLTFEDSAALVPGVYIDKNGEINTKEEGRPITRIELAGRQHLVGDKNFQNYVDTQNQLGNIGRVKGEVDAAIQAEVQKLGITIDMQESDIGGIPAWLKSLQDKIDANKPFEAAADVSSPNQTLAGGYQGYIFSPTGKMKQGNEWFTTNKNGDYIKFTDTSGKPMKVKEAIEWATLPGKEFSTLEESGLNVIHATKEETEKMDKIVDAKFTTHVQNTFLARYNMQNVPLKQQKEFLEIHKEEWDNLKNRVKVQEAFNKSIKDFANIEPELWLARNFSNTTDIEGLNVPKTTDSNILTRNLEGKRIKLLGSNTLGLDMGGKEDMNTLMAEIKRNDYVFDSIIGDGLMKINPTNMMTADGAHTLPAASATMTVHKGEGATKDTRRIKVAIGLNDMDKKPFLQLLQDVGNTYLKVGDGSKFVPAYKGAKNGYSVTNISGSELGVNVPFVGFVQYRDENGVYQGEPKKIQDWQDWYIEQPNAKEEANSLLLNK